jgi:hypothetical protein
MIRPLASVVLAVIALSVWPTQARASEDYDNCTGFIDSLPASIGTQGTWCLRKDLSTAMTSGNAIEIATNNVTIDCNDFKIGGLSAGIETLAIGVRAADRFNTTVRNCRIRGFRIGLALPGQGGGHRVEDNTLEGSRSFGMIVQGAGSVVRRNRVIDSGGSTRSAVAVEAGIEVIGGVDVIDNLVSGVRPFPIQAGNAVISRSAAGIYAVNNDGGSIIGNRVSGAAPVGSERGFGIRSLGTVSPTRIVVSGNILKGSRSSAIDDIAIGCVGSGNPDAISVDNVLIGFDAALQGCSPGDNSVNTN